MKIVIASSRKNRVEERVCIYSLIAAGHSEDQILVANGDNGEVRQGVGGDLVGQIEASQLAGSTSFTFARLYLPLVLTGSEKIIVIDSDTVVLDKLEGIFSEAQGCGMYARRAYAADEWATSVLGWRMNEETRKAMRHYREYIESDEFSWQEKIYLKPRFLTQLGIVMHRISRNWNEFDALLPETKLLHFTNLATQPWKRDDHPLERFWFGFADAAYKSGYLNNEHIAEQNSERALRSDFIDLLKNVDRASRATVARNARLLYRNLKFHSPLKYLYSEFSK